MLLILVTALGSVTHAATPVAELLPTCAWVRAENDGAGAGFVVDVEKRLLVTCRHLVADRKKVDVLFPWHRDGELVTDRATYLANRVRLRELGLLTTGRVLKTSDELDLALLELEALPPGARAVTFAASAPQPGGQLRVVGNRLDLDTVWNVTTGVVRARGPLVDGYFWRGKKLAVNADVLIGQLPTEEGDSGGPVFDSRGALVGTASALRRQCPLAAVCISAKAVREFAGVAAPDKPAPREPGIAEALTRATVWVRPTATDVQLAGVLIEADLVLTLGKGLTPGDCVGIAFPHHDGKQWVHDRAAYRDPLAVQLRGEWRSGRVLARDRDCGLALVRLDSPVAFMKPVKLATRLPMNGEAAHTLNHPGGLEFAWVYAAGSVRQRGKVAISLEDKARRVDSLLCQLPAQAGSPGGAVVSDRGELVGIVSAKESVQLVGYAVTVEEIAAFLDRSLTARTLRGLHARVEELPEVWARAAARGSAQRAEAERVAGKLEDARRSSRDAIALDAGCTLARLVRARLLLAEKKNEDALHELDAAVEKGPFDRAVLLMRAELAAGAKDWRKARGDLERALDVYPGDAEARQRLVGVLLELGDDARAANAVRDTLRADVKRLPAVARDLLAQADALAKKYPDAPGVPAGWLLKATTAANRPEFAEVLKLANAGKDDTEKLAVLRAGLGKVK